MADEQDKETRDNRIELSAPWSARVSRGDTGEQSFRYCYPNGMPAIGNSKTQQIFILERSRVHQEFIRESEETNRSIERTKRTGLWLAAGLIAIACVLPVFAPDGRETISYLVSASLVLFAAGAAGFTAVSVRSKQASLSAGGKKQIEDAIPSSVHRPRRPK